MVGTFKPHSSELHLLEHIIPIREGLLKSWYMLFQKAGINLCIHFFFLFIIDGWTLGQFRKNLFFENAFSKVVS